MAPAEKSVTAACCLTSERDGRTFTGGQDDIAMVEHIVDVQISRPGSRDELLFFNRSNLVEASKVNHDHLVLIAEAVETMPAGPCQKAMIGFAGPAHDYLQVLLIQRPDHKFRHPCPTDRRKYVPAFLPETTARPTDPAWQSIFKELDGAFVHLDQLRQLT